jgi:alkylhydroperoxidase/carboxymuconolactone decarboxylase family protein YurZ
MSAHAFTELETAEPPRRSAPLPNPEVSPMPRISLADPIADDLGELLAAATNGRRPPLNLHLQMASAPVVLAAYVGIRRAIEAHGTLDPRIRFVLMLAVSAASGCEYTQAVNRILVSRAGLPREQIEAVLGGEPTGEATLDALLAVAREVVRDSGIVTGAAWRTALDAGVTEAHLAEAYASIGLAVYVDQFVNYADTPYDVPAPASRAA